MNKTISIPVYVDNISDEVEINDLRHLFQRYGPIDVVTIMGRDGFVNFISITDALDAIKNLNGHNFFGRRLIVESSKELDVLLSEKNSHHKRRRSLSRSRSRSRRSRSRSRRSRSRSRRSRSRSRRSRSRSRRSRSRSRRSRSRSQRSSSLSRSKKHHRSSSSASPSGSKKRKSKRKRKDKKHHRRRSRSRSKGSRTRSLSRSSSGSRHHATAPDERTQSSKMTTLISPRISQSEELHKPAVERMQDSIPESLSINETKEQETHKLHFGNFISPVEREDLERLVDRFGDLVDINMFDDHAVVTLACTRAQAEEAVNELDNNVWMDNTISVTLNDVEDIKVNEHGITKGEGDVSITVDEDDGTASDLVLFEVTLPQSVEDIDPVASDVILLFIPFGAVESHDVNHSGHSILVKLQTSESRASRCLAKLDGHLFQGEPLNVRLKSSAVEETLTEDKKIKDRTLLVHGNTKSKTFLSDMSNIVFPKFGMIRSCRWLTKDRQIVAVVMYSSEVDAVRCISEVNSISYKGQPLRVKFEEGSSEDSPAFRRRYLDLFHNYPTELIPQLKSNAVAKVTPTVAETTSTQPEVPIGVLPPSSSLGAFGALPDMSALTSIIESVRRSIVVSNELSATNQVVSASATDDKPYTNQMEYTSPGCFSSVLGKIHSVSSKMILIQFFIDNEDQLARVTPGQMFIDAKTCLGLVIKNKQQSAWPESVRSFLKLGSPVKMDVRQMTPEEEAEMAEWTSEAVHYIAPLVWSPNVNRPNATTDLTLSSLTSGTAWVLKATVFTLYPTWALLRSHAGDIYVDIRQVYVNSTKLNPSSSLLDVIGLGDVMAVHTRSAEYLEMAELVRGLPGFEESGSSLNALKYVAKLIWFIHEEVDPFTVEAEAEEEKISLGGHCRFLATSATLNHPLPSEKEAPYKGLAGVVEELHLPSGGLIYLDVDIDGLGEGNPDEVHRRRRVYFHRSRVTLNGARCQTADRLEHCLVVGDRVTVDVIRNGDDATFAYIADSTTAAWVAVSMRVHTVERGRLISRNLRLEGVDPSSDIYWGHIVFLHKPNGDDNAVHEGVAVIASGSYAGQRLQFNRSQCYVFGHRLNSADLSYIFNTNEAVYLQVKSYNSFLLEKLWVGGSNLTNEGEADRFRTFLSDHGLDDLSFRYLLRGKVQSRPFIPIASQGYRGKIKRMDHPSGSQLIVEALDFDMMVEANREIVYIFGHNMAKADLRHILQVGDEVHFEVPPVFDEDVHESAAEATSCRKATLVWYGGLSSRPCYVGQSTKPVISPEMDSGLWKFVRTRNMDEKMFRALVEGYLPPKPEAPSLKVSTDGPSTSISNDSTKSALLKQMKDHFGQEACLDALMMFIQESGLNPEQAKGVLGKLKSKSLPESNANENDIETDKD